MKIFHKSYYTTRLYTFVSSKQSWTYIFTCNLYNRVTTLKYMYICILCFLNQYITPQKSILSRFSRTLLHQAVDVHFQYTLMEVHFKVCKRRMSNRSLAFLNRQQTSLHQLRRVGIQTFHVDVPANGELYRYSTFT